MSDSFRSRAFTVDDRTWWFGYAAVVLGGLFITFVAQRNVTTPFLGLSLALLAVILTGWTMFPRASLYAVLALTVVSDQATLAWYPFVKNLSSRESISFVADSLTVSPLDLALVSGVAISALRQFAAHRRLVADNPLRRPMWFFFGFVLYGFVRGISSGGDVRIAVLVGRPLLYVFFTYVIAMNELTEPKHRRWAFAAVIVGIVAQSLLSIEFLTRLSAADRDTLESFTEHGAAIGHNLVIVFLVVLLLFRVRRRTVRWAVALGSFPVIFVYLLGQRRAGVAALLVAGIVVAIMLFWRARTRFWVVVPFTALLLAAYTGAFWNSTSSAGFPAQAVKTVIAPDSASAKDQSSDLYRDMEAFNLNYTIRTAPITGYGFGQPFLRPVPLPDISVFELNAYQPHNSVLWVWTKLGFFGFTTMLYLLARTIVIGIERCRRMTNGIDFAVTFSSVLFVIMYAVYTYVDVSWDARNTVLFGLTAAICCTPETQRPREPDRPAPRTTSASRSAYRSMSA